MTKPTLIPPDYAAWLADLKSRIATAQFRATLAVNSELVRLYWEIGRGILERQVNHGWGTKVIDTLAKDLRLAFPEMKGFSPTNLKYMRRFAEDCPERAFGQQLADQLPWFHVVVLLTQLSDPDEREWYAAKAIEYGWSRNVLGLQIEVRARQREGKAVTNFPARLPAVQSDFAQQALKDPYLFDFLALSREASERDIEQGLTQHITRFLLELGAGFAFVGRQVHIEVAEDDFFIDLLFYHLKLRCYIVIELKAMEFKPEHAGQLSFYLTAVDRRIKAEQDTPTIGLLLCRKQNRLVAEYALSAIHQPIGVAEYQLTQAIPPEFAGSLPTIEELEAELQGDLQVRITTTEVL
ncbi:MAG TPA: PDDEXK nuclease domain-containing protein [Thermoanaerobaculia bacterium]|nr:PDDEXK nuclease domain-containing protein [Thermoanaerobaculia bacterium]